MADAKTQSAITIEEDRKGGFFMMGLVLLIIIGFWRGRVAEMQKNFQKSCPPSIPSRKIFF